MDFQRLFLFLIFSFSLILVWDGWQRFQHPQEVVQQSAAKKTDLPAAPVTGAGAAAQATITQLPAVQAAGKSIHVKTDFLEAEINTVGGDIQRLAFLKQPDGQDKTKPFVLFQKGEGTHNYVAQSGLLGEGMPNHNTLFAAEQDKYELAGTADRIQVRLTAAGPNGVKVTKVLTFQKGSYLIDVALSLIHI